MIPLQAAQDAPGAAEGSDPTEGASALARPSSGRFLAVSEIFGPTIQGEGPSLGTPAVFLRLAGCNLGCSWCDTPYTWDWSRFSPKEEVRKLLPAQAAREILNLLPYHSMLVVSGGEPLLQQNALIATLADLSGSLEGIERVEIETAGTIIPDPDLTSWVSQYNISPKLAHSGNALEKRYRPEAIDALRKTGKAIWKFVIAAPSDLLAVKSFALAHRLDRDRIYLMPQGVTHDELMSGIRAMLPKAIAEGWRITPRLHIDLWGQKRGV